MADNVKKLYRIKEGKILCGVCTGLAEYFTLDISVVRLLVVLASLVSGAGVIAYIIAALVVPEKPENTEA